MAFKDTPILPLDPAVLRVIKIYGDSANAQIVIGGDANPPVGVWKCMYGEIATLMIQGTLHGYDPDQLYWYQEAGAVNADLTNVPAGFFVRDITKIGLGESSLEDPRIQKVSDEIGQAIYARIQRDQGVPRFSDQLGADIERLAAIKTSHGIGVKLRWRRRDDLDPTLAETIALLAKPPDLRTAEEDHRLCEALGRRIDDAHREDPGTPYRELIARVLDYRDWHVMTILLHRPGHAPERLSRRTALSEGEKKIVSYLPLFAAVAASCDGLAASAPEALRFVLLDDAFAKVSEDNHPKLFGLLVESWSGLRVVFVSDLDMNVSDIRITVEQVPDVYAALRVLPWRIVRRCVVLAHRLRSRRPVELWSFTSRSESRNGRRPTGLASAVWCACRSRSARGV